MSTRRLAAIMFSDIVSYNTLMGSDEKKAFEFLKKNRRIHRRLIRKHRGRWLKEMGDGILASFSSITDAVMCALSIQKTTEELNIPLRIGIHQGEVIFEKMDVLGDGVNIASRIQGSAETNGIVISETVYNDIKNKDGLELEYLGEQTLKGVTKPIGIYKVACQDDSFLDFSIDTGELVQPLSFGRTSIVLGVMIIALIAFALYYFLPKTTTTSEFNKGVLILPFDNYTSDTLEYYTAGMHNALITDMGKISALKVISKTTARAYKNIDKSIPEIAAELGVNAIIEGSVLCLGDSVCLQIQMKNTDEEEDPLWVQDFYVERSQILNLYNRVAKEISDKINVNLKPQEEILLAESRMVDPDAYDAYMRGQFYWEQVGKESMEKAMDYFQIAIEKDPDWAPPYAGLAAVWIGLLQMGFESYSIANAKIYENLNTALTLNLNSADAHYYNAVIAVWTEWNWEKGEREFRKALELNPSDALCRIFYAHLLMILHRSDEALYHANLALELDPMRPLVLGLYGQVMNMAGDYQSAISHAEKALSIDSNNYFAYNPLTSAYYFSGDYLKDFNVFKRFVPMDEEVSSDIVNTIELEDHIAAMEIRVNVFEEAVKEGGLSFVCGLADDFLRVKNYNKAFEWLEVAYEIHSPNLPYLSTYVTYYPELKNDLRYIEFMNKMNLPLH